MYTRYKLCSNCGYKNPPDSDRCNICESKILRLVVEERKTLSFRYLFLLLPVIVLVFLTLYINKKQPDKKEQSSMKFFVSEDKPFMNYYTYINSLEMMKRIQTPDENDLNAVLNALRYNDPDIRKKACSLLMIWKKTDLPEYKKCNQF